MCVVDRQTDCWRQRGRQSVSGSGVSAAPTLYLQSLLTTRSATLAAIKHWAHRLSLFMEDTHLSSCPVLYFVFVGNWKISIELVGQCDNTKCNWAKWIVYKGTKANWTFNSYMLLVYQTLIRCGGTKWHVSARAVVCLKMVVAYCCCSSLIASTREEHQGYVFHFCEN